MSGPTRKTRDLVIARDEGRCVRCSVFVVDPESGAPVAQYSLQHRSPRGMGGTKNPVIDSPANLVVLCGTGTTGCHGKTETARARARLHGWSVSRYQDPREVPMLHDRHGWVLVGDTYSPTEPIELGELA